ncbi:cation:proton antiporter domain-containing protein [Haloechinothrix halophila]|uniref:NhaP-type Na+(K+)/H+ antiporter n=1 Tax=Haloechinothrix halophila YIM 93223 TaxID=592678 RepID=W9DN17_9PSEU|nr:cation:proton antiporter [Haloechinothrix halophila]ETA66253.1 NhaP-type Na+(K+)/H+ antiporter [Haloechinothrix halophila YIM 93223]
MELVFVFGLMLLLSVSLSGLAARTVLSTSLLFLLGGALLGNGGFGVVDISAQDPVVAILADIALFTVLITDGQRANLPALKEGWRLSGRALGVAMPLTMLLITLPTHFLLGLDWTTSFLIGAILAPTDPVFAAAIVGRKDVPLRVRRLLNVESGLNDGLALPFVLVFIAIAEHTDTHWTLIGLELVGGFAIGIAVPALVALAWRLKVLTLEPRLQPLGGFAIAVAVFGLCHLTEANQYLAAFAAGATLATIDRIAAEHFEPFGELLSEVTKFGALLLFGALLTPNLLSHLSAMEWVLAVAIIVVVRPLAMYVSLLRTQLPWAEKFVAAWFGPKGFASVVYGLLVLRSDIPNSQLVFELVAITIALSIVLHSSTDVPIAKRLRFEPPDNLPHGEREDSERS